MIHTCPNCGEAFPDKVQELLDRERENTTRTSWLNETCFPISTAFNYVLGSFLSFTSLLALDYALYRHEFTSTMVMQSAEAPQMVIWAFITCILIGVLAWIRASRRFKIKVKEFKEQYPEFANAKWLYGDLR